MPEDFRETRERVRALLAVVAADVDRDVVLERLRSVRQVRQALDTFEAAAIYSARAAATDWSEIGGVLGMSGQAAGKRARQRHQLADPRSDSITRRPLYRGTYHPREYPGADEDPPVWPDTERPGADPSPE